MGGGQRPGEALAWRCSQRAPSADGEVASSRMEARTREGILVASSEISGPSLPLEWSLTDAGVLDPRTE